MADKRTTRINTNENDTMKISYNWKKQGFLKKDRDWFEAKYGKQKWREGLPTESGKKVYFIKDN